MKDFQRGKDCRTLESLPQTCVNVAAEAVPAATPLRRACACLLYVVDESLSVQSGLCINGWAARKYFLIV